jgi:putative transposase
VLLKIVYLLTGRVLGLAVLVFRGDLAKDAELLVLRHENAVLRRHAGNLTLGERSEDVKFLIRDRGPNFTAAFDAVFQAAGTRILRTAVQAPRMNAICERLVGTLRRELPDRVLILGEAHLRTVLAEYQAHYNTARPHQGIAQRVPDGEHDGGRFAVADLDRERIHRKPVLSGLVNEYSRAA